MSALGFRARMVLAGAVLFAVYLGLAGLTLSAGAGLGLVALQCVLFVLLQFVVGRRLALRSVGTRPIRAAEQPRLHRTAREVAADMGMEKPRLMVGLMGTPNAFTVGRRGNSEVVFSQSLLEVLGPDERRAVLVHEIPHVNERDALVLLLGQTIGTACGLTVMWVGLNAGRGGPFGVFAGVGGLFVQVVVSLLAVGVVRQREFHADAVAGEYVDPEVLPRALKRIDPRAHEMAEEEGSDRPRVGYNLRSLCIYGGHGGRLDDLFGTHPAVDRRVRRLTGEDDRA